MRRRLVVVAVLTSVAIAAILSFPDADTPVERHEDGPTGHFRAPDPAQLDGQRAEELYQSLRQDKQRRYGRSDVAVAGIYQDWQRHNRAPYRSATHGERFVNNYANERAAGYGARIAGDAMPAGSVLAKDSFVVTDSGDIYAQSLFLMEKMPQGVSPEAGDWRYLMITPSGEVFGDTRGENPGKVGFCHECHRKAEDNDYLFFLPEEFRPVR